MTTPYQDEIYRAGEAKAWREREDRKEGINLKIVDKLQELLDKNDGKLSAYEIFRFIESLEIPNVSIDYY